MRQIDPDPAIQLHVHNTGHFWTVSVKRHAIITRLFALPFLNGLTDPLLVVRTSNCILTMRGCRLSFHKHIMYTSDTDWSRNRHPIPCTYYELAISHIYNKNAGLIYHFSTNWSIRLVVRPSSCTLALSETYYAHQLDNSRNSNPTPCPNSTWRYFNVISTKLTLKQRSSNVHVASFYTILTKFLP